MHSRRAQLIGEILHGKWPYYLGAVFAQSMNVLIGFITPLVFSFTLDNILGNEPINAPYWVENLITSLGGKSYLAQNLWLCSLLIVTLSILNGLFQFMNGRCSAMASERISEYLRNRLYKHLQHLTYDYHVKAETGDLIQRCTSDVETVRRFLSVQLMQIIRALLMLVISLSIMLPKSLPLTLAAMSMVPIIFLYSMFFFKKVIHYFTESDTAEGVMSATLQENLTGVRVVRAFGRQKYEMDKFEEKNHDLRVKSEKLAKLQAWFWGGSDGLCMIQTGIVLIVGVFMAAKGSISLGTLMVFVQYENMLLWPVRQLGRILSDLGKSTVSLNRIDEVLLQEREMEDEGRSDVAMDQDIVLQNVSFGYSPDEPVLKDVSFTVKKGQTVAILGATGSGKSTLMHLMQRLYDYQSGSIAIGGVELNQISKRHVRERIGIILQEPFLYSRSIKENIAIVHPESDEEEIYAAAKTASIHHVIQDFENGYDTVVGERGVTLSGGQKQRIAIARTLMKDNDILIFDDSLSAVDTQTDAAIREALQKREKKTTFIISHRITTLSQADLILVLDNGRIVQSGTHKELISQPGLYKRIYDIQSSLETELNQTAG